MGSRFVEKKLCDPSLILPTRGCLEDFDIRAGLILEIRKKILESLKADMLSSNWLSPDGNPTVGPSTQAFANHPPSKLFTSNTSESSKDSSTRGNKRVYFC